MTMSDTMFDTAETIKDSADHYEVRSYDPLGHKALTLLVEDMRLLTHYFDSDVPSASGEQTKYRKNLTEQIKRRFGIVEDEDYENFLNKRYAEIVDMGRRGRRAMKHNGSEVTAKNYVKAI